MKSPTRAAAADRHDEPDTLLIGDIARATGRSIHTIRWYESQGLLPGVVRDASGRRCYSAYHVSWLDLMDRLRCTGMSIAQLREYTELVRLGAASLPKRRALLAEHRARVQDNIRRWTEALGLIAAKVDFYDEWIASGAHPSVSPHQRLRTGSPKNGTKHR